MRAAGSTPSSSRCVREVSRVLSDVQGVPWMEDLITLRPTPRIKIELAGTGNLMPVRDCILCHASHLLHVGGCVQVVPSVRCHREPHHRQECCCGHLRQPKVSDQRTQLPTQLRATAEAAASADSRNAGTTPAARPAQRPRPHHLRRVAALRTHPIDSLAALSPSSRTLCRAALTPLFRKCYTPCGS